MEFQIQVRDCVAEIMSSDGTLPQLVCDNTDHTVRFLFDEAWDAYTEKVARFVYREDYGNGDVVCKDVTFRGDTVSVPLLHHIREVWIGVIAGTLRTTTAARLSCLSSIYSYTGKEEGGCSCLPVSAYIVQETGDSPDKVMSQRAVTAALAGASPAHAVKSMMLTLPTDGWEDVYLHVACEIVREDSIVLVDPTPESTAAYAEAGILCVTQAEGGLSFKCRTSPSEALNVQVVVL